MKYDWNEKEGRTEVDGYSRGVAVGEKIMLAHVHLEEGAITKSHSHDYEEILYVVSGKWFALRFNWLTTFRISVLNWTAN
ncbi:MAG: hypothetical protein MUC29_12200 [Pyrinomonadaceae bacterium]|nr:hypothetical protein [Pyrinomonadaceae bacterium]